MINKMAERLIEKFENINWIEFMVSLSGGVITAAISNIFGDIDRYLYCIVGLMGIDYLLGCVVGIHTKNLSSYLSLSGLTKKCGILVAIFVTHQLDVLGMSGSTPARNIVIGFYIVSELISICENLTELGVPLPKQLTDILGKFKKANPQGDISSLEEKTNDN